MARRRSRSSPRSEPIDGLGPVRTCLGCRQRALAADLLRVVLVQGRLVADPAKRLPGRGASIHPTVACLEAASRRKAWGRALRVAMPVDPSDVEAVVRGRV
ncbi:MAG: YlxR family protein [Actinomycetales bacterium]|nr:YlxR family protein [Actinomycetales bacterium]